MLSLESFTKNTKSNKRIFTSSKMDKTDEIVFVKLKDGKKTITKTDLSGKEIALFTSSQENLAHPVLNGDSLFFNSGVTGLIMSIFTV
jgi:hypothetical protein